VQPSRHGRRPADSLLPTSPSVSGFLCPVLFLFLFLISVSLRPNNHVIRQIFYDTIIRDDDGIYGLFLIVTISFSPPGRESRGGEEAFIMAAMDGVKSIPKTPSRTFVIA
jgi:hypothetical protein